MNSKARNLAAALLILLLGLPAGGMAQGDQKSQALPPALFQGKELVRELQKGGYVIYLRHASTDTTQEDSDLSDFKNCAKQRNLSEAGRKEAKLIGEAVKRLKINISSVTSSPFCRCMDTATLAFGKAAPSSALYFAIGVSPQERQKLTESLKKMLGTQPPAGTNAAIVSHTANLQEAAGIWPKPEGVAIVFKPEGEGKFKYAGAVLPTDWPNY